MADRNRDHANDSVLQYGQEPKAKPTVNLAAISRLMEYTDVSHAKQIHVAIDEVFDGDADAFKEA